MRPFLAFGTCLLVLGCAGNRSAASPLATPPASLYDRLGGLPAITAVVDEFMKNLAADERINAHFAGADLPDLRQKLIDLVCQTAGGPCVYAGRSMKAAHQGMNLKDADFDAVAGDLQAALNKLNVPAREQGELLSAVGSLRPQIVHNGAGAI